MESKFGMPVEENYSRLYDEVRKGTQEIVSCFDADTLYFRAKDDT